MKNIITIDIDSDRIENPILITKPQEMLQSEPNLDDILKKDINDITLTSLYMASMLSDEDEMKILGGISKMIKDRKDEITEDN